MAEARMLAKHKGGRLGPRVFRKHFGVQMVGDRSRHRADSRGAFAIGRSQNARKAQGWPTELTAEVLLPMAEARMLARYMGP